MKSENNEKRDDIIVGRNPVSEALRSGRGVDRIIVTKGEKNGAVVGILAKAKKLNIPIKEADVRKLDFLSGHANHQGIIAYTAVKEYSSLDDIFKLAEERNEKPFIIVLDEIEDPHNLGAIIRTAECTGAHGVIIPKRRSAGLSFAVSKASAGAVEYVPVARVTNISNTIEELKKRGVWVYGADMNGTNFTECDFSGAAALVIGNEGKGISRLVREKCDEIVSLPMKGKIKSLNASVAAGVLMYAVSSKKD
jgi:23S rRNA (guanosine2251-2'-O)-methyltransferase